MTNAAAGGRGPDKAGEAFTRTTHGVEVSVRSAFLPEQSAPEEGRYAWAYRVSIRNLGDAPVRLLRRTWRITDARGREQRVHGDGVVGQQPVLQPGESFQYSSGTPLATPTGFMVGYYHMIRIDTGEPFDVDIPAFSLDSPHQGGSLH